LKFEIFVSRSSITSTTSIATKAAASHATAKGGIAGPGKRLGGKVGTAT
jgi:hypothetical protein